VSEGIMGNLNLKCVLWSVQTIITSWSTTDMRLAPKAIHIREINGQNWLALKQLGLGFWRINCSVSKD